MFLCSNLNIIKKIKALNKTYALHTQKFIEKKGERGAKVNIVLNNIGV